MGEMFKPTTSDSAPLPTPAHEKAPDKKLLLAGTFLATIMTAFAPEAGAQTVEPVRHTTSERDFGRAVTTAQQQLTNAREIESIQRPAQVGPLATSLEAALRVTNGSAATANRSGAYHQRNRPHGSGEPISPNLNALLNSSSNGVYIQVMHNNLQIRDSRTTTEDDGHNDYHRVDIYTTPQLAAAEGANPAEHLRTYGEGVDADNAIIVAVLHALSERSSRLGRMETRTTLQLDRSDSTTNQLDVSSGHQAGYLTNTHVRVTVLPDGHYEADLEADVQIQTSVHYSNPQAAGTNRPPQPPSSNHVEMGTNEIPIL